MRLSRYGITLERLTVDHLEMVRLWRNQDFVRNNMEFRKVLSREDQQNWFAQLDRERNLFWVICTHRYPIGLIHIKNIDLEERSGEAGIFVGEPSYLAMPQPMLAILFMMELAFHALRFNALQAKIRSGNRQAIDFNTKLGYRCLPGQPEGFQYYQTNRQEFDRATAQLRQQAAHMFGKETQVKVSGRLGTLESELLKGLSAADDYFTPRFL